MTEHFDAATKALEIENLAKTYLDHIVDRSHPIESSVIASEADTKLRTEFAELQKNPEEFVAVGKELEILGNKLFSALPNVHIDAKNGRIVAISFQASSLDFTVGSGWTHERIEFCDPTQTSC